MQPNQEAPPPSGGLVETAVILPDRNADENFFAGTVDGADVGSPERFGKGENTRGFLSVASWFRVALQCPRLLRRVRQGRPSGTAPPSISGRPPHPRRPPEHGCQEDCRQGHPLRASGENGPETPLPVPAHARGTQVSNHGVKNFA